MTAVLALSGWAVIATLGALAMHRARRAATPTPPQPVAWTDWTLSQPPVPTQAEVDSTWVGAWPVDCAGRDEVALRLEQIAAAEGWTPVTEEWAA